MATETRKSSKKAAAAARSVGALDNLKTIVYAGLIAVGIRTVAFEPFNIPSGSMIPTLLVGDYLFVSKYSYGYSKYAMPFAPDLFSGRIFGALPHRGDVAVFRYTHDTSIDYVKRVIGLPGDHVQVRAGQLYLNGTLVPRHSLGDYEEEDERGTALRGERFVEDLPNGPHHQILKLEEDGEQNNTPDYLVPAGYLFMMGDDRDDSADSRFQGPGGLGFVPTENLVGKAQFIFFSIGGQHAIWQFWYWPAEIRWGRLLRGIYAGLLLPPEERPPSIAAWRTRLGEEPVDNEPTLVMAPSAP